MPIRIVERDDTIQYHRCFSHAVCQGHFANRRGRVQLLRLAPAGGDTRSCFLAPHHDEVIHSSDENLTPEQFSGDAIHGMCRAPNRGPVADQGAGIDYVPVQNNGIERDA